MKGKDTKLMQARKRLDDSVGAILDKRHVEDTEKLVRRITDEYPGLNFDICLSGDELKAQNLRKLLSDCEYGISIADSSKPESLCMMRMTEFTSVIVAVLLENGKVELAQLLAEFAQISADFEDCLDKLVEAWKKVSSVNEKGVYCPSAAAKNIKPYQPKPEDY